MALIPLSGNASFPGRYLGCLYNGTKADKIYLFVKKGRLEGYLFRQENFLKKIPSERIQGELKGEITHPDLICMVSQIGQYRLRALHPSEGAEKELIIFSTSSTNEYIEAFSLNHHELPVSNPHYVARKKEEAALDKALEASNVVCISQEEDVECQTGKTELALGYSYSRRDRFSQVFWFLGESSWFIDQGLQEIRAVLEQRDHWLIVIDQLNDFSLIQPLIELAKQKQGKLLVTTRATHPPFPTVPIGLFSEEESIEYLIKATGNNDRISAQKLSQELGHVPSSLKKAAEFLFEKGLPMAVYSQKRVEMLKQQESRLAATSQLPPLNPNFVGREVDLVALEESFEEGRPLIIGAQVGLGGIGKTQIALQYAQRNAFRYNFIWVFNAESENTLILSYRQFATRHQISIEDEKQDDLIDTVHQWLKDHPGWLLIYDDAAHQNVIRRFLPASGGHILITSRTTQWTEAKVFKVGLFKKHESVELLLKITHREDQKEDAALLADLLENLPLAIDKAACFIRETGISFGEYIQKYQEKSRELWKTEQPGDDKYKFKVSVAWTISMNEIRRLEKMEAERNSNPILVDPLMHLCSFFSSAPIPHFFLEAWITQFFGIDTPMSVLARTIRFLSSFSMIETVPNNISLHAVVQTVTRDFLDSLQQQKICSDALSLFYKNFSHNSNNEESNKLYSTLVSHAEKVVSHAWHHKIEKEESIHILMTASCHLGDRGNAGSYTHGLRLLETCLSKLSSFAADHLTPNIRAHLSRFYRQLGLYDQAVEQHRTSLIFLKNIKSRGQLGAILIQFDEALLSYMLQKYDLALQQLLSTVLSCVVLDGSFELNLYSKDIIDFYEIRKAFIQLLIGEILLYLNRFSDAECYLLRALKIAKKIFSSQNSRIVLFRTLLGNYYQFIGNFAKAKNQYEKNFEIETVLGDPFSIVSSRVCLGYILKILGNYKEAKTHFLEALKLYNQASLENHPDVIEIRKGLCDVLAILGETEEVEGEVQKVLEISRKLYSNNPTKLAETKIIFSKYLIYIKKNNLAKTILEEALLAFNISAPEHRPFVIEIKKNLSLMYNNLENKDEAYRQLHAALQIGREDLSIAEIRHQLARLYMEEQKYKEALIELKYASENYKKSIDQRILLAQCIHEIGICHECLLEYDLAFFEYQNSLKIYNDLFSPHHLLMIETRHGFGCSFGRMRRIKEGEHQFNLVFASLEKNAIQDIPKLAHCRRDFAILYFRAENYEASKDQLVKVLAMGKEVPSLINLQCKKLSEKVDAIVSLPQTEKELAIAEMLTTISNWEKNVVGAQSSIDK